MLTYPDFDPIAFSIGSFSVRWYGLTYLAGFAAFWLLGRVRASQSERGWTVAELDDVLFYAAIGVIAGGRLGYALFYDLSGSLADPLGVLAVWRGGMSFHGGLLGVFIAMALYARSTGRKLFEVTDFVVPMVPLGLGFGRIGNFINGELWGKQTDIPWGMVFPDAGPLARHPSQLYQALLEGVVLFTVVWLFSSRPRPMMAVSGLFLAGYGMLRALIELVRVPDEHIGYLAFDWLTMGQLLSLPMILAGGVLLVCAYRSSPALAAESQPQPQCKPQPGQVSAAPAPLKRGRRRKGGSRRR